MAHYGVELKDTGHPALPFMGEGGCTVAPHLRPLCSLHVCAYSFPARLQANAEYELLRSKIIAESERQGLNLPAWYNSARTPKLKEER